MLLGFALTEHCNLRCPHCIRDDVTTVRNLDPSLVLSTIEQARALFGEVTASFTGGEPTLHPAWEEIVGTLHRRGVPYRFVTNGWHMRRLMPLIDRHPPAAVRVSLSGADEATHDEERGRGSFRRVLLAVALLTSRRIPASLSLLVDRRDLHQIRQAADLAERLGCVSINFALAQPVPGGTSRATDLSFAEWHQARDEVFSLAREERKTAVWLDYGFPFAEGEEEAPCHTFERKRLYVDAHGRLSLCCQLSEYGNNERDVVADLRQVSLSEIWPEYVARLEAHRLASLPRGDAEVERYPCIRCARALGKMQWVRDYPDSQWLAAAEAELSPPPVRLAQLTYPRRTRSAQPV